MNDKSFQNSQEMVYNRNISHTSKKILFTTYCIGATKIGKQFQRLSVHTYTPQYAICSNVFPTPLCLCTVIRYIVHQTFYVNKNKIEGREIFCRCRLNKVFSFILWNTKRFSLFKSTTFFAWKTNELFIWFKISFDVTFHTCRKNFMKRGLMFQKGLMYYSLLSSYKSVFIFHE